MATVFSEVGLWPSLDFLRLSPFSISVHRIFGPEVLTEGGLVPLPQPSVPGRAGRESTAHLLSPFKFSLVLHVLISEMPFLRISLAIPSPCPGTVPLVEYDLASAFPGKKSKDVFYRRAKILPSRVGPLSSKPKCLLFLYFMKQ